MKIVGNVYISCPLSKSLMEDQKGAGEKERLEEEVEELREQAKWAEAEYEQREVKK